MRPYLIILVSILSLAFVCDESFKSKQMRYSRVKKAFESKEILVKTKIGLARIHQDSFDIYVRIFKREGVLEAWGKNINEDTYRLIESYNFCSNVGIPGPKRKKGDLQIPEGFYQISRFNPESNYHLSVKVNYPNKADSIKGERENLGGDIYIHGGCETVGCIPITDSCIEELYLMLVLAKNSGQNLIPVHIFPTRLNYSNMVLLKTQFPQTDLHAFWESLKPVYEHFEQKGELLDVIINPDGNYNIH
ncbi:MAG: hypothetical protein H6607_01395 [Flavobacteriales bacterium]|nr:hypothetical protein [Flavobacteriales bacterium]